MNRFKEALRYIIRWVQSDDVIECEPSPHYASNIGSHSTKVRSGPNNLDEYNSGFNFTVFSATGGKVVRVHQYDPKNDRHISNLYIITDKEDFGEELAQIITRDSLSR
jgi:hypothetical protein